MSPAPADTAKSKPAENSDEVVTTSSDAKWVDGHNSVDAAKTIDPEVDDVASSSDDKSEAASPYNTTNDAPPLPEENLPPLPDEEPPAPTPEDDGWAPVWEETAQAFYFYNRFTGATQWTNPRVPDSSSTPAAIATAPGVPALPAELPPTEISSPTRPAGGYDPAIHGDYDPTAWYAQPAEPEPSTLAPGTDPTAQYAATGAFNRFTGRWQAADVGPELHNDENKSKRQMNAFFDVDAAANSHDGRSLKAERSGKKLSKTELKQFKEKRKAKKEEKRRAWLRD